MAIFFGKAIKDSLINSLKENKKINETIKESFISSVKEEIVTCPNDSGEILVLVNPSKEEFLNLISSSKYEILRGAIANTNLFVWDAFLATHDYAFETKIKNNEGLISKRQYATNDLEARILIKDEGNAFIVEVDNFIDSKKEIKRTISIDEIKLILKPILDANPSVEEDEDFVFIIYPKED